MVRGKDEAGALLGAITVTAIQVKDTGSLDQGGT